MKKSNLVQKVQKVKSSMLLLLAMILFQLPLSMKAQTEYRSPVSNTLFGTSDSRLTATIKQVGNQITMTVGAVGVMVSDVFEFNVLFNPDSLAVTDSLFNPITDIGIASIHPAIYGGIRLEPALKAMQFSVSQSSAIRDNGKYIFGGTGHDDLHSIDAHIHNLETSGITRIDVNSAEFVPLYSIFFVKKNADPLTPDAIGFNIRTALGLVRSICWVYEGAMLSYDRTLTADEIVNPALFSFRSPSSVQTKTVTDIAENTAIFHGLFKRGDFPPAYNILDSVAPVSRQKGKLLNDTIVRYGFFYTEGNVDIAYAEYSDSIIINGVKYPFPHDTSIAKGYFMAGADIIYIAVTGNSSSIREQNYADTVTGLKPNSTYNLWAFAEYAFETSKHYPLIGLKETFTTSQMLNIASTFSATDPDCGLSNGSIQVHVLGGSGSFQYSLDGKNYFNNVNGLITGLAAGTYRVYVRDAADTLYPAAVSPVIILNNKATDLALSVAATNASDCSAKDGILHVSATGGSGNGYTYTWKDGTVANVLNNQITGLPAGVYALNVSDGACAAASGEVHIASNTSILNLTLDSVRNADCGLLTGAVYFKVTGTNYYSYQIDGMSVITATSNNQIVLGNLSAGDHTLRVFDTCGLEKTETIHIYNGSISGFAIVATPVNQIVSCDNQVANGNIFITASNGVHEYQYTVDGIKWHAFAAGKDTVTIQNLGAGTYYVQVKDDNDCTYEINNIEINREVEAPLNVLASFTSVDPTCGNTDGSIQVQATGGSGNYKFSYSTNAGATFIPSASTNGLIANLGAGTYTIQVQDANHLTCAAAQIQDIILYNSNTSLNITVAASDASTCSTVAGDGQLLVSVSGGSGKYSYTLNGNPVAVVNGKIENLPVGLYIVNVIDNDDNCLASSGNVRISSSASSLALTVTDSSSTVCGSSVGTATFTVTGASTYSYQVDNMPIVTVAHNNPVTVSGLSAGVHTLQVFDACAARTAQIVITNGVNGFAFAIDAENKKIACDNSSVLGSILLTASNGTKDYKYSLDGGAFVLFAAGKDTATIFGLNEGVHHVRVEDATGCSFEWNSIQIDRETLPLVNIGTVIAAKDPTTCGGTDGEIQIYPAGGSGVYEYSLDGNSYYPYANGLITGLSAGTYKIHVRDANHNTCAAAVSNAITLLNRNSSLAITLSSDPATTCASADGKLYVSISGGSGNYEYILNGVKESPVNGVYSKPAGAYILEVMDKNNNCVASSKEEHIYGKTSAIALNVNSKTHSVCGSSVGSVTFTVSGATPYNYEFDGLPAVSVAHNNSITLSGLSAGTHHLRVFDDCGEASEQIIITNGAGGLSFTADVDNSGCATNPQDRKIILNISGGTAPYRYTIDNGATWSAWTSATTITISNVLAGSYDILLQDTANCQYENTQINMDENGTIVSPTALSPQTFCIGATVANLQATGVGIKWYTSPNGGLALSDNTLLDSGRVYYAAQTIGNCESQNRTAVKAFINANVVIDAPSLDYNQALCNLGGSTLTLADIATNGSTNIVWFDQITGGNVLPVSTVLTDSTSYYAAFTAGGSCQSITRAEVFVTFTTSAIDSIRIASPQYFCNGALVGNIVVPNNQIVWYSAKTGGVVITEETPLVDGETYYAAYKTGNCESNKRTPVTVHFSTPDAPVVPDVQTTCGGNKQTLADLTVTGFNILWYDAANGGNVLPANTSLVVGATYYAAQSSASCESDRAAVRITDSCFTLKGTMFPFVQLGDKNFDTLFPVIVKLYAYPASLDCDNPLSAVLTATPILTTTAKYYDGSQWIPNTPKNPGTIGKFNNPGLPVDWKQIGKTAGVVDNRLLTPSDNAPEVTSTGANIGWYELGNVPPASYLLVISRQGFVTRIGKITITDNTNLGHRELIAGDVNIDFSVSPADESAVKARFSTQLQSKYGAKYDMSGDGEINGADLEYVRTNNSATFIIYEETKEWIEDKCN